MHAGLKFELTSPCLQGCEQGLLDLENGYPSQGISALKSCWRSAKALPRIHELPRHMYDANTTSAVISQALSKLDWTKPLAVDVGCGLGSFAIGLAQEAEAFCAGRNNDVGKHFNSVAADKLLIGDWNVVAVDVSRVAVRRCTAVASRLGLSHRCVP
jgi:methylase of polypeptide subunit release factors